LTPFTREKALGQFSGIRQRDEMAACDLIYVPSKPITRNSPLEFDRKEPVVSSR